MIYRYDFLISIEFLIHTNNMNMNICILYNIEYDMSIKCCTCVDVALYACIIYVHLY